MNNRGKQKDGHASQDLPPEKMVVKEERKSKDKKINPYSLAVGRALKRLRESKNLGQGEAALEANFSLSYLSNVERGNHALSLNKFMSFSDGIHSCPEELCRLLCEEIARGRDEMLCAENESTQAGSGDPCDNLYDAWADSDGQREMPDCTRADCDDPDDAKDDSSD